MASNINERIFFYCCPPGTANQAAYQHSIICLAEGLKLLEIPYYADRNYWKISPEKEEYLFRHDPNVTPDDCSIVIFNDLWLRYGHYLPENLFHPKRKYITVYMELWQMSNESLNPEFRQFDFVFKAHCNRKFEYPANCHPWTFGLSNRILQASHTIPKFQTRKTNLLVNYRVNHPVRKIVREQFFARIQNQLQIDTSGDSFDKPPTNAYDFLMWQQTGRRHYPQYYNRLKSSSACACFGGRFQSWPRKLTTSRKVWHRFLNKLDLRTKRILGWDSWRFWESLATGCVPFHVDYEKYAAILPVMPENWKHYIGIDLNNINETICKITENHNILAEISAQGRDWVIKYYSPLPTAKRFLKNVNDNYKL